MIIKKRKKISINKTAGMKKLSIFFFLGYTYAISAQVTITPGAQFYMTGNTQLTFQNADLVNNGNFSTGNGTVSFTGNSTSIISGSQPVQFYQLEINKTSGFSLSLLRSIGVTQQTNFTAGFIDLNGNNLDLGNTGKLNGEKETSHVIGANGGKVLFSAVLNAPSAVNPGNLGAIITSSQNLGNVIIGRGHQSQVNDNGIGNSILRYYDIAPANNSNLDATLRVQYFDNELNGLLEGSLVFWSSSDNTHWTNQGFTTNNTTTNYVEKTGVPSFSRWTLSSVINALPVRFTLFNTRCNGSSVLLIWKTGQEQNAHYYAIERSADGVQWTVVANVPAAGNTTVENNYSYTDNLAPANNYYRIAEYDMDGKLQYSGTLKSSCGIQDLLSLWPNPARNAVFITIGVAARTATIIKVYDSKGALIKIQKADLLPGSNQLYVDINNLAGGMYQFAIEWNNGQSKKTMQVFKE